MIRRAWLMSSVPMLCLVLILGTSTRTQSQQPPTEPAKGKSAPAYNPDLVTQLVAAAKASGDVRRGAMVFRAPQFACQGCHKVGQAGGIVGPELTKVGACLTPEQIVESVLWPKRQVKDEYKTLSII